MAANLLPTPHSACRSSILPSAFTQPICIREDTEYLSFGEAASLPSAGGHSPGGGEGNGGSSSQAAAAPPAADETGPLPMYEDTQFLTGPLASSGRRPSGEMKAAGRTGGGGGIGNGDDTTGLLVREDTCFLPDAPVAGEIESRRGAPTLAAQTGTVSCTAPFLVHREHLPGLHIDKHQVAACSGIRELSAHDNSGTDDSSCFAAASAALEQTGGLQLYEDTGFLTENVPQPAGPHAVSSHPASSAAPALEQTSGIQLYEDTGLLDENAAPQTAGPHALSPQPAPAAAPALEQTGGLQLYEDTGFLTENVAPQPARPQAVSSQPDSATAPALEQTGGPQLYEVTGFLSENVPPQGLGATPSLAPHLPAAAAEQPSNSQQVHWAADLLSASASSGARCAKRWVLLLAFRATLVEAVTLDPRRT